ncbi:MAG: diguanylate cyclase [Spirochaetales bacterium]|nr:diguanylate cyclase [Spirochaetales bacterium]
MLIVDDDMFVREMIEEILTQNEFSALQANDAQEALELLEKKHFNVIITDINMPGMSGLELVETIRSRNMEIPIIVLTVNSEMETAVEAVRKGADDYILKGSAIADTLPLSLAKVLELYDLKIQNRELILDLSRKNAELEHLAFLDGLTGIYNRRFYDITLESEWETALKAHEPLALIMSDIDKFKNLNDTFGHQYGDLCIQRAAKTMSKVIRRVDGMLARFGGDEFIALLRNSDTDFAAATAESMRLSIEQLHVTDPDTGEGHPFTMSFGVYSFIPDRASEPESLLEGADKALYQAKKQGRNRVLFQTT